MVSFEKSNYTIHFEKIECIVNSRTGVGQMETIVIAIGGPARMGKSFLLNIFVSYYEYLEKVSVL